jgi:hypothetical protein
VTAPARPHALLAPPDVELSVAAAAAAAVEEAGLEAAEAAAAEEEEEEAGRAAERERGRLVGDRPEEDGREAAEEEERVELRGLMPFCASRNS